MIPLTIISAHNPKVYYKGLSSTTAYFDFNTWKLNVQKYSNTLKTNVIAGQEINVCDDVSSNSGNCPADGWYQMDKTIILPTFHDKDWFFSGFSYHGEVKYYETYADSSSLIGHCWFEFTATHSHDDNAFLNPPSAAQALKGASIVIGVALSMVLVGWMWMNRDDYFSNKSQTHIGDSSKSENLV